MNKDQKSEQGERSDLVDRRHGAEDAVTGEPRLPEGLRRERKGPLNPSTGRGTKIPKQVPDNFDPKHRTQ
jgi:hypothetical protein